VVRDIFKGLEEDFSGGPEAKCILILFLIAVLFMANV